MFFMKNITADIGKSLEILSKKSVFQKSTWISFQIYDDSLQMKVVKDKPSYDILYTPTEQIQSHSTSIVYK